MAHRTKRWKRLPGLLCFVICISSLNVLIHVHFEIRPATDFEPCSGHILRHMTSSERQTTAKHKNRSVSFDFIALHFILLCKIHFFADLSVFLYIDAILETFLVHI